MFTRNLRSWVKMLKEGEMFFAKEAYSEYFQDMDETTFYQLLARLHKNKLIGKLDKGLYYRPYSNDPALEPSEDDIISFFTNNNKNGLIVGAHMLVDLGIIKFTDEPYEIYTNTLEIKSVRKIRNISLRTINIDFKNENNQRNIKMLELIENIDKYENINYDQLYNFILLYAHNFDQESLMNILYQKSYKKRNIAIIYDILEHFHIPNTLMRLLNKASRYEKSKYIEEILNNKI